MKPLIARLLSAGAFALIVAQSAQAVPFVLDSSTATIVDGNTTSTFYEVNGSGADSGTAALLYKATISGVESVAEGNPPKVEISFEGNPQPVLTSAFIKASNRYLWWDEADLAAFNAGTWTSLILIQDGLLNNPGNAYHSVSHAGLNGRLGTTRRVPDGGSTLLLSGLALSVFGLVSRYLGRKRA